MPDDMLVCGQQAQECSQLSVFSRNIAIDIDRREDGVLVVTGRMVDVVHDITLTAEVTTPHYSIVGAEIDMARVPDEKCHLICPIAKQLVGLAIGPGFSRSVLRLLGGKQGCPNVLNLIMVSLPLAINAAHMTDDYWLHRAHSRHPGEQDHYLKGICIAHPD